MRRAVELLRRGLRGDARTGRWDQLRHRPRGAETPAAEIDAAAFHAYGLDREKTQLIWDDFPQVQNLRLMTDDYFDLVLKKYDELPDTESVTNKKKSNRQTICI